LLKHIRISVKFQIFGYSDIRQVSDIRILGYPSGFRYSDTRISIRHFDYFYYAIGIFYIKVFISKKKKYNKNFFISKKKDLENCVKDFHISFQEKHMSLTFVCSKLSSGLNKSIIFREKGRRIRGGKESLEERSGEME